MMMYLTQNRVVAKSRRSLAIGVLLAALMAAAMLLAAKPAHAQSTFTVTNTNDSGAGSLRQAIRDANATTAADTIAFNIPTTTTNGVATISPDTALPPITNPVTIDGYSQPGAEPKGDGNDADLKIELSGQNAGSGAAGLQIAAANSTVKGLVVNRWGQMGISIGNSDATGNKVVGNYVGTDASGTQDLGNSFDGVVIYDAPNNTIGGATAGERNIISGNNGNGVYIVGDTATGNKVVCNYVGTDASGTQDLCNYNDGVVISNLLAGGAPNNTIGGTTAGERNVISGNDGSGVYIAGANTTGNKVVGNYVGTDASGIQDLGNSFDGVFIYGAPNNTIGGATAGERNVISGNESRGINITGNTATGNKVVGNYVGTDASGTQDLGNSDRGVFIYDAPNNTIGGATAGERNVISGNDGDGVQIFSGSTGTRVLSNSIFSNGALGIDLGFDGPTANDPGDADIGPNHLQNYPEITSAKPIRNKKRKLSAIAGNLNSTPNQTFIVQLFSNPSGTDEGKTFIGQRSVVTDSSGNTSFSIKVRRSAAPVGSAITAIATNDSTGDTSEFSAPKTVVAK